MTNALSGTPINESRVKSARSGNRERIIGAGVELMNSHGTSIKTSQIAAHLGISPGNLYYHFRNFEEIASEVLQRLRTELKKTLAIPDFGAVSAAQLVAYYSGGAEVLWRYRYMVSAGRELISRAPDLELSYMQFTLDGVESVRLILENLLEHHPSSISVNTADCKNLAENMWVLWSGLPRYIETTSRTDVSDPSVIAEGLQQVAFTLSPYLEQEFNETVRLGLRNYVKMLQS